jgi:transposase
MAPRKINYDTVKFLYTQGLNKNSISKQLNCSPVAIGFITRKLCLPKQKRTRQKIIDRDQIKLLTQQGKTEKEIAKILNCSQSAINQIKHKELKYLPSIKGYRSYLSGKELYSIYLLKNKNYLEISQELKMPLRLVQEKIGFHLMSLCRLNESCPTKALLPEYRLP